MNQMDERYWDMDLNSFDFLYKQLVIHGSLKISFFSFSYFFTDEMASHFFEKLRSEFT